MYVQNLVMANECMLIIIYPTGGSPTLPLGLPAALYTGLRGCVASVKASGRHIDLSSPIRPATTIRHCDWQTIDIAKRSRTLQLGIRLSSTFNIEWHLNSFNEKSGFQSCYYLFQAQFFYIFPTKQYYFE